VPQCVADTSAVPNANVHISADEVNTATG